MIELQPDKGIPRRLLFMMAAMAGLTVANLYYNQPLLELMRADIGMGEVEANMVTVVTQAGYALGLCLIIPLGDLWSRRRIIVTCMVGAALMTAAIAIATEGANLYDKLVGFTETLTDLGRSITKTGEKYEQAVKQLKTGRGNLIKKADKLKDLLQATKNIPAKFADYEDTDDTQLPTSDYDLAVAARIDERSDRKSKSDL